MNTKRTSHHSSEARALAGPLAAPSWPGGCRRHRLRAERGAARPTARGVCAKLTSGQECYFLKNEKRWPRPNQKTKKKTFKQRRGYVPRETKITTVTTAEPETKVAESSSQKRLLGSHGTLRESSLSRRRRAQAARRTPSPGTAVARVLRLSAGAPHSLSTRRNLVSVKIQKRKKPTTRKVTALVPSPARPPTCTKEQLFLSSRSHGHPLPLSPSLL